MSIINLGSSNFGVKGRTLTVNVRGPVLVFFKMDNCPGCKQFTPIFTDLAMKIGGCQYSVVNLTQHREIIGMSRQTDYPIQAVPLLLFFHDGYLRGRYKGKRQHSAVNAFVRKMLSTVVPTQSNMTTYPHGGYPSQQSGYPQQYPQQGGYPPQQGMYPQQHPQQGGYPPSSGAGRGGGYQPQISSRGNVPQPEMPLCDPNDPECLLTPPGITPHNKPWDNKYQKMGTLD